MAEPAAPATAPTAAPTTDIWRIHRRLLAFVVGLLVFIGLMAWAEQRGLSRNWIGPIFLFATIMVYAAIGIYGRTADPQEYYVAGRRIPGVYNGMATAADWMSAASFISLSGALYLQGFGGLAYLLGWTGGFCLVALLIAPHLRRLNLYTVPDYFQHRYGGRWPRVLAGLAAVLCSFVYVVAQIYGIGLIASRLTGVQFEIGILLGLGGVLLCSFLGGMRAITWTQVAQYIVVLLAFLIPVSWLAYKQLGNPVAPLVYGQQLQKIERMERELAQSEGEQEVRAIHAQRAAEYAARLQNIPAAMQAERAELTERIATLKRQGADFSVILKARRELNALPATEAAARELWTRVAKDSLERSRNTLGGLPPHTQAYEGDPHGTPEQRQQYDEARRNFLALMFCLMLGTAGLPHLLTRYYTTPDLAQTRSSVAWSLLFIGLLYVSAPALAALVKYEVMRELVGLNMEDLPYWVGLWASVDPTLIAVTDINADRTIQFGEIHMSADIIMLATPEMGGLPYVVSGLVAAGGLAAALSTADGLLLTISNAIVHDISAVKKRRRTVREGRVILSKFTLLVVAMLAAFVAALKPAEILALVSASFSLAAAAFFPGIVMGIFWPRNSRAAVLAGMVAGLGVTAWYMLVNTPAVRATLGLAGPPQLWLGIQPISAGLFGVAAGFAVMLAVSLWPGPRPAVVQ